MTEELFREDAYQKECEATVVAVDENGIVLDKTVFYPTGGGQPGDMGVFRTGDGRQVPIIDTRKAAERIVHVPEEGAPALAEGDTLTATLDWDRRYMHMRIHTSMHILCSQVDAAVTGGQIGDKKGRIDFDIPGDKPDKEVLGAAIQAVVDGNHPVSISWITDAELEANPELVRTMSVKPPTGAGHVRMISIGDAVDYQPCGGTHLKSTGEIGRITVGKIENKGKQNRRINIHVGD